MKLLRLVIGVVALVIPLFGSAAGADVNRYTIIANSPKPTVCNNSGTIPEGTWLQNKPCGYFIGTALAGSSFDVHQTNPSNYHYGRNYGNNNLCAWIPPGALSGPIGTAPASCSEPTKDALLHRRSFGYQFNVEPFGDGYPITVNTACWGFRNYYNSSSYSGGVLRDLTSGPISSVVRYRYTAYGSDSTYGAVFVARDPVHGWLFIPTYCIVDATGLQLTNADD